MFCTGGYFAVLLNNIFYSTHHIETGLWVKTQLTLYRNGKEGKLPSLSSERIKLLEEIGINWGERRRGIPWEERYQALLEYKVRDIPFYG